MLIRASSTTVRSGASGFLIFSSSRLAAVSPIRSRGWATGTQLRFGQQGRLRLREAHHGDLFRNAVTPFFDRLERPDGELVVETEHRVGNAVAVEYRVHGLEAAFAGDVPALDEGIGRGGDARVC